MPGIGIPELIIVLVILLIVFGPKRLPELGRSLGRGIREFRGSISGDKGDDDDEMRELEKAQEEAEVETTESVQGEVVSDKRV